MKIKVYFGCSLTHAPDDYKLAMHAVKERLRQMDIVEILDFIGEEYGTAQDVYEHDIHECVKKPT